MIYTLSLFNTGQITLPRKWRTKFKTKKFIARETNQGLLIQPLAESQEKETVYYEDKNGFGLYADNGLSVDTIISKIQELNGQD